MTDNQEIYSKGHLSSEHLLKYYRHQLSETEQKAVDNHLSSCELCTDAYTGMQEMHDSLQLYNIVHELKLRMKKRVVVRKKIFSRFDLLSYVLILFVLGVVIFIAFYFIYMKW